MARPRTSELEPRPRPQPTMFILGGNSATLAFVSDFRPDDGGQLKANLLSLAWTPIGVVIGGQQRQVGIPIDAVADWIDQTFSPDDERSFVASMRDVDLLVRLGWHADVPREFSDESVVNADDLPEDILDGLGEPIAQLTQCAMCRRTCVQDDFVWGDRRLCAWDFHSLVFGRRGPWREGPYEARHFVSLPAPRYVAPILLDELSVEIVASFGAVAEPVLQRVVNELIAAVPSEAFMATKTPDGLTLLRERREDRVLRLPPGRS